MLREILEALKGKDELGSLIEEFAGMLELSAQIVREASQVYFGSLDVPVDRESFRAQDVKINKLERKIRKRLLWLLAGRTDGRDAPTALLLMSLVKDAERIGDYAKDLALLTSFAGGAGEADAGALRKIADEITGIVDALPRVFRESDQAAAAQLVRQGRTLSDHCEAHLKKLAGGPTYPTVASHLLGTQYYLRTLGHAMNILSGLVNPLHKLDYHDEKDMLTEVQLGGAEEE
jgi:phosphate uptake regulator